MLNNLLQNILQGISDFTSTSDLPTIVGSSTPTVIMKL